MKATIVDLRYRMKEVLRAVERGETVTVLQRGRAKAQILPIAEKRGAARLDASQAFGLWRDREDLRQVSGYFRRLRRGRFDDL